MGMSVSESAHGTNRSAIGLAWYEAIVEPVAKEVFGARWREYDYDQQHIAARTSTIYLVPYVRSEVTTGFSAWNRRAFVSDDTIVTVARWVQLLPFQLFRTYALASRHLQHG